MHRWAAVLIVATLCFGCAADRDARRLAYRVFQTALDYEKEVDKKIAAEKAFYRDQLESIRRSLIGYSEISKPKSSNGESPVEKGSPEKTLLYGRIRVRAERDARLAADEIINSSAPKIMVRIIRYVDKGVKEDQAFYQQVLERQRLLTVNLLTGLEKIDQQRARLKAVREHLRTLATEPGPSAQLKQRVAFGMAIWDQIKKDQREMAKEQKDQK